MIYISLSEIRILQLCHKNCSEWLNWCAELQQVQARAGYSSALAGASSSAVSLGKRRALGPGLGVDVPGVDPSACNTSLLPSLSSPATAGTIEQCR